MKFREEIRTYLIWLAAFYGQNINVVKWMFYLKKEKKKINIKNSFS